MFSFSFLQSVLFNFFFSSVLIASKVLLMVEDWDINVKTSEPAASSLSFHSLESCILFPCLGYCLHYVLTMLYKHIFSFKISWSLFLVLPGLKNEFLTPHQLLLFTLACTTRSSRNSLYYWVCCYWNFYSCFSYAQSILKFKHVIKCLVASITKYTSKAFIIIFNLTKME